MLLKGTIMIALKLNIIYLLINKINFVIYDDY